MEFLEIKKFDDYIQCIDNSAVCIVYYCNEAYFYYTCTTILSVLDHAEKRRVYDIIILVDSNISSKMAEQMNSILENYSFASVRIINIQALVYIFAGYRSISYHLSTCYRLFVMSDIFCKYKKIITMDSDMICNCDMEELYDKEIDNYCMAVNYEMDERWKIRSSYPISAQFGVHSNKEYLFNYVGIKDETQYFCAGLILWNLDEVRKNQHFDAIIYDMKKKAYLFPDQDLLNLYYEGKTVKLPPGWNHVNYVLKDYNKYLSDFEIEEYEEQRKEKKIIHYAGKKPWNFKNVDDGEYFWEYAKKTPWYYEVREKQKENIKTIQLSIKRKRRFNFIFPEGSQRKKAIRYLLAEFYKRGQK